MKCSTIPLATATFGLLLGVDASSPAATDARDHPDVVVEGADVPPIRRASSADSTSPDVAEGISITPDNQILVELAPDHLGTANLFDLSGRTVVFRPNGRGGYSRVVGPVAWVEDIGPAVADGVEIQLGAFTFDFAGSDWSSFFVSRHGLLTFGEPLAYSYWGFQNRFAGMSEIAAEFVTAPTISPLFKPMLGGRSDQFGATQHVTSRPDRIVVTWITTAPDYYIHGVPPTKPSRFQVVLW